MLKSRLRSVFQRKCELLKKQLGIKLCVYKRQGRRGCLRFLACRGGFGYCFVNLHEDFVSKTTLMAVFQLEQRWWFDCNTFKFFFCPPPFLWFQHRETNQCIYHQYLSQLLNFMKLPEVCTVQSMYLHLHTYAAQNGSLLQHTKQHLQETHILWCRFSESTASRRIIIKSWPRSQVNGHHPKPQLYITATQKVYMVPHNVNVTSQATVRWN